eukprot:222862-Hanusia_phi.AAC.1
MLREGQRIITARDSHPPAGAVATPQELLHQRPPPPFLLVDSLISLQVVEAHPVQQEKCRLRGWLLLCSVLLQHLRPLTQLRCFDKVFPSPAVAGLLLSRLSGVARVPGGNGGVPCPASLPARARVRPPASQRHPRAETSSGEARGPVSPAGHELEGSDRQAGLNKFCPHLLDLRISGDSEEAQPAPLSLAPPQSHADTDTAAGAEASESQGAGEVESCGPREASAMGQNGHGESPRGATVTQVDEAAAITVAGP